MVLSVTPSAPTPPVVLMLTADAPDTGAKLSAPPVEVKLTARTLVVEMGPVPEYKMVAGAVVFIATKPGPGTTVVPPLTVPPKTVTGPSTQLMLAPVCEHVVACANALPGRAHMTNAVDTLLSSARRTVVFFILYDFLLAPLPARMPRQK